MKEFCLIICFLVVNSICSFSAEQRTSGEPIPRYASLKSDEINARVGPAITYPIKYIYKSKYQPVKIINEYYGWYQVKDVMGDVSWIHKNYIDKNNFIVSLFDGIKLYNFPDLTSNVVAYVNKNAIFKVLGCDSGFCEVITNSNGHTIRGFLIKDNIWGI